MTLVKIDIKNVASETHPDDKVVFRSPVVREATGVGLVSTADEVVTLVDGVGEVELVPGPVIVTFQCRGVADTRPKRGDVPDSGTVNIAEVIEGGLTFTPPVVNRALEMIRSERDHLLDDMVTTVAEAVDGELGTAVRNAETAATAAVQAAELAGGRATSAESKVDSYTPRVVALEAMAGLSPESPVDGQTANLISQTDTLTRSALNGTYATRGQANAKLGRAAAEHLYAPKRDYLTAESIESLVGHVVRIVSKTAYQDILDLAEADGWAAVYDPGNPETRTIVDGKVAEIADGLGNLPPLTQDDAAQRPRLEIREYGALTAVGGDGNPTPLRTAAFPTVWSQPNYILTVAQSSSSSGQQFIFDGISSSSRNALIRQPAGGYSIFAGREASTSPIVDNSPHVFGALFNGPSSILDVDGKANSTHDTIGHTLTGLTVGNRHTSNGTHWRGTIGPVLLFDGEPSQDVKDRMSDLLLGLMNPIQLPAPSEATEIGGPPRLSTAAGITVVDEDGYAVYTREPDVLRVPASTLKLLSAFVARRAITDDRLDDLILATETLGPTIAGTQYTAREMFYSSILPSDNGAARAIADYAGTLLLDGESGDPRERFWEEVRTVGAELGWAEHIYVRPDGSGLNYTTPRDMADMTRRALQFDPFLKEVAGTLQYTLHTGTVVTHSSAPYLDQLPGWIGGKTGTLLANQECLVGGWTTSDGRRYWAAVLASETGRRYPDMNWLIDYTENLYK